MGKLVEAVRLGYYGNVRVRPGTQFVMADSMFEGKKAKLDKDGEPVLEKGVPVMEDSKEEVIPSWVVLVEGAGDYEDPIFESEAELKSKNSGAPKKRVAAKKEKDEHMQDGKFDVHPELGIQVTGQVRPATPAASSFVDSAPAPKDEGKKGKSVI